MCPVYLQAMGSVSALGQSDAQVRDAIFARKYPGTLQKTDRYSLHKQLTLGCIDPAVVLPLFKDEPYFYRSRNNQLAWAATIPLQENIARAVEKYGAHRIGLVVGTSTSGVQEGEQAASALHAQGVFPAGFDYALQEMGNVGAFLSQKFRITGPSQAISTACSSGAKAIACAARWLDAGLVDVVIAGGVDALCSFTVAGFSALESVASELCNPLSAHRNGINLGEAAAFFVMGREEGPLRLAGWGESQDAYHMSAPDPMGHGAMDAIQRSLQSARLRADQIDYINLHGTATPHNDAMESRVIASLFGSQVAVSSTKPITGHALAAAGAIEAVIAWHVLVDNSQGNLPVHWWDGVLDTALPVLHTVQAGEQIRRAPKYVLSNSFAFGGSNAALVFAAN